MSGRFRFQTYLFDLDGTLIDSIHLIMEAFRFTMRTHLGTVPDETQWRSGFGTPLRSQLEKFARSADQTSAMVETYRSFTNAHHDRLLASYAGIDSVLERLRNRNVKLGIVTSKSHRLARRGLVRCGLSSFFDVLVGVDDVFLHKPDPAPVVEALEQLSAEACSTVFIGDSPFDICAGRKAGVHTAAALWGPFGRSVLARESPDYWLSEPECIVKIERKEGSNSSGACSSDC